MVHCSQLCSECADASRTRYDEKSIANVLQVEEKLNLENVSRMTGLMMSATDFGKAKVISKQQGP